jgi:hypothetical protein
VLCIDLSDERKILENLDPKYFQHPLDMAATNNLAKVRAWTSSQKNSWSLALRRFFSSRTWGAT